MRDLSLNFFFVAPALRLPFSPVVHPVLEAVFNLVLAWAAAFAAFASDGVVPPGRGGSGRSSMWPTLLGMQFLTNAVLLPYLALRPPPPGLSAAAGGDGKPPSTPRLFAEDLGALEAAVGESRALGPALAVVGAASVGWGLFARGDDFGDVPTRFASASVLLSHDRLGASFLVDLALFAAFQGWLVDDDLRRRGVSDPAKATGELKALRAAAKFLPFFGLCAYAALRPPLPSRGAEGSEAEGA